ncbi:MAG: hypothetical protein JW993_15900 [Sedimentisphaerales bacterium]|nr:hypothetical protein [Sedimentisphaerales bacterium]
MTDKTTLNRFPLFGLFCCRAALRMGKSETQSELLGYSMAVLYAIFKSQVQRRREGKEKKEKRELPEEARRAKTELLRFGGHDFMVIKDDADRVRKSVVGHEIHEPEDYGKSVRAKFPDGWHDRLAKAFDRYLQPHPPSDLEGEGRLYELYRVWRDDCQVGRNRVDLEQLEDWLAKHAG